MDSLRQDLRYTVRALLHRPGFALLAILTLAVGIGVNTVAFGAVNALLLRPFKVERADRIGWILVERPGNPHGNVTLADYQALARSATTFREISAEGRLPVSLHTASGAQQAWSMAVSANYLETVGARPTVGRVFTAADLGATDVPAVVSQRFWTEKLGETRSLAGARLVLNGRSFAVVGVLPDDFQGPGGLYAPDVWLPLERLDVLNVPASLIADEWLTVFGRLRDGVTPAQAGAELAAIAQALPSGVAKPDARRAVRFYPMAGGHPDLKGLSQIAWIAMGIVALVLLIACFNVAALLLARAGERQREIGVRSALGASRARILQQLITEGVVLALLSGAATLVFASWSGDLLATFSLPAPIPQRLHLGVDRMLVGFTGLLVLIAGLLPAVIPAMQATRANLLRSLRAESSLGGGSSRTRNGFVMLQIAGSTLFLAAALLFVRSFLKTAAFEPGFDTQHTMVLQVSPSLYGYDDSRARLMLDGLRSRISALPGVVQVGIADRVPFYVGFPRSLEYSGDGGTCAAVDCRRAIVYAVAPGHFDALGMPIRQGRDFTAADLEAGNTVVVSERMAAELWPGETAIGRTLRVGNEGRPVEVIGVVVDIKHRNMTEPPGAYLYRPLAAGEWAESITIVVRASGEPRLLLGALQEQVRAVDPNLPVALTTMADRMKLPLWPIRTAAGFFLICGVLALLLATVGLFGVLYFTITQRTREFGIRVALGATSGRVVRLVLREGLALAVPGVLLGGAAAFIAARFLSRGLFGITPGDPVSFAATVAIQLLVALAACALPARRATRADPMAALRQE